CRFWAGESHGEGSAPTCAPAASSAKSEVSRDDQFAGCASVQRPLSCPRPVGGGGAACVERKWQMTNYQLPITNYQIPITNYQLQNWRFRRICNSQLAICHL